MTRDRSLDVAVIGVSARFPGCSDLDDWWSALLAGRVLTHRYERHELIGAGVQAELVDDPNYVPVRGHLDRAEHFDHHLFRVSPREAELMDPQHRLMLEMAWGALEDAAVGPADVPLRTGVFASSTGSGYMRALLAHGPVDPAMLDDLIHGTEPDFVASRIAYKLGLTGPALAVQTACSSSLVAVHLAVQSLMNGDCEQALVVAAGVGFPQAGYLYLPGGVLSPSGACRPFSADADGVVGGSGVACVVLRRLADALADGPEPYGVILGTSVNNDGSAKIGYYAPSAPGQEAAISAALRVADVDGRSIGYLESHGTGTTIGDPIEWSAAAAALSRVGARPGQVAVGALKANIGHLDAAAGLAALIKVLWAIRAGMIPPVAGFTRLNPLLDSDASPLYVPTQPTPWPGNKPRRAGVSAFGIGGTNAHVVVEQAPERTPAQVLRTRRSRLVLLSAGDPQALSRAASRLGHELRAADPDLGDVAYTLASGRAMLPYRMAVTGGTAKEVAERLAAGAVGRGHVRSAGPAPVVFLFPGQGSQRGGMARPYVDALPGFASSLDRALGCFDDGLASRARLALLDESFPADEFEQTELAQPALFAFGYAAAAGLREVGVGAAAVAGHSMGEIVAATVAGVLDLADAAAFIAVRGRVMSECRPGAMLALGCDEDCARRLLAEAAADLEIASVNGQDNCVVAGPIDVIEAFARSVGDAVWHRRLRTNRAFHSRLIDPAVPRLAAALSSTVIRAPVVPIAMNVSGSVIPAGGEMLVGMLVEQARRPVLFGAAIRALSKAMPQAIAVEVGPGRALCAMAEAAGLTAISLSGARSAMSEEAILTSLGALWASGQPVAVNLLCRPGRRLHLPTYAFAGPRLVAAQAYRQPGLDAGGKQDAASRPDAGGPDGRRPADGEAAPDARAAVAGIWAELLGHSDLTDSSDFFELGGDSLLFTRLARRVNDEFSIKVPLREMLAARTLGGHKSIVAALVAAKPD